jgi:pimeloyl-ACP methyl ester carboxylesterase
VRYDERGNGLSDWDAEDISFEAFVTDLETVVDKIGLDRFPLLGVSQDCPVSIAYAVRHPEKVSRLVLYGGYAVGAQKRQSTEQSEQQAALAELVRVGWGQDNPAFRQVFTSLFIPEGTPEQMQWLNELQRITVSPENAVRHIDVIGRIDVRPLLK